MGLARAYKSHGFTRYAHYKKKDKPELARRLIEFQRENPDKVTRR